MTLTDARSLKLVTHASIGAPNAFLHCLYTRKYLATWHA